MSRAPVWGSVIAILLGSALLTCADAPAAEQSVKIG